jgi:hypothetical protein
MTTLWGFKLSWRISSVASARPTVCLLSVITITKFIKYLVNFWLLFGSDFVDEEEWVPYTLQAFPSFFS